MPLAAPAMTPTNRIFPVQSNAGKPSKAAAPEANWNKFWSGIQFCQLNVQYLNVKLGLLLRMLRPENAYCLETGWDVTEICKATKMTCVLGGIHECPVADQSPLLGLSLHCGGSEKQRCLGEAHCSPCHRPTTGWLIAQRAAHWANSQLALLLRGLLRAGMAIPK